MKARRDTLNYNLTVQSYQQSFYLSKCTCRYSRLQCINLDDTACELCLRIGPQMFSHPAIVIQCVPPQLLNISAGVAEIWLAVGIRMFLLIK